jgi:glycerol kinase
MQAGVYPGLEELARNWHLERRFLPAMDERMRQQKLAGWADAVQRTLTKR